MEGQGLKITFLISEKIVEIGGGRGEGHAGKNNCEYKWKKELLDVRAHLLLWDCRYTYFHPKLSVLIFADQNPKLFHYCNTSVPAHG